MREMRGGTRSAGRRYILVEGCWKRLMLPLVAPGAAAVAGESVRETHFLRPEVVEDVPRAVFVGGCVTLATGAVDAALAHWNGTAVRGFSKGTPCWPGAVAVWF